MGPLWICLGVYITVLSVKYADLTGESKTGVLSKFNGMIQAVIPLTFVFGNFITSSILQNVRFGESDLSANTSTFTAMGNITHSHLLLLADNNTGVNQPIGYEFTTAQVILSNQESDNSSEVGSDWLNSTSVMSQCGPNYCPDLGNGTGKPGRSFSKTFRHSWLIETHSKFQ